MLFRSAVLDRIAEELFDDEHDPFHVGRIERRARTFDERPHGVERGSPRLELRRAGIIHGAAPCVMLMV